MSVKLSQRFHYTPRFFLHNKDPHYHDNAAKIGLLLLGLRQKD